MTTCSVYLMQVIFLWPILKMKIKTLYICNRISFHNLMLYKCNRVWQDWWETYACCLVYSFTKHERLQFLKTKTIFINGWHITNVCIKVSNLDFQVITKGYFEFGLNAYNTFPFHRTQCKKLKTWKWIIRSWEIFVLKRKFNFIVKSSIDTQLTVGQGQ